MACGRGKGGAESGHGTAAARARAGLPLERREAVRLGWAVAWLGSWAGPVGEEVFF